MRYSITSLLMIISVSLYDKQKLFIFELIIRYLSFGSVDTLQLVNDTLHIIVLMFHQPSYLIMLCYLGSFLLIYLVFYELI